MKVFHYTGLDKWAAINDSSCANGQTGGLVPSRSLGKLYPPAKRLRPIYALPEPIPEEWVMHPTPQLLKRLTIPKRPLLLAVEIDPQEASVVDWAPMERVTLGGYTSLDQLFFAIKVFLAERRYVDSRISLVEYLQRRWRTPYRIPEVLITKPVHREQITVADEQPALDELWQASNERAKAEIARSVANIPELNTWFARR
jgi:hypothetical protein